jgi:hypothetical protein
VRRNETDLEVNAVIRVMCGKGHEQAHPADRLRTAILLDRVHLVYRCGGCRLVTATPIDPMLLGLCRQQHVRAVRRVPATESWMRSLEHRLYCDQQLSPLTSKLIADWAEQLAGVESALELLHGERAGR